MRKKKKVARPLLTLETKPVLIVIVMMIITMMMIIMIILIIVIERYLHTDTEFEILPVVTKGKVPCRGQEQGQKRRRAR